MYTSTKPCNTGGNGVLVIESKHYHAVITNTTHLGFKYCVYAVTFLITI